MDNGDGKIRNRSAQESLKTHALCDAQNAFKNRDDLAR